jgi:hypothetical protein
MAVIIEYADSPAGNALDDFNESVDAATAGEIKQLDRLHFRHFHGTLRGKSSDELAAYLDRLRVWRSLGPVDVFKTSDTPCFAYVAFQHGDEIVLLILGVCREYPVSEQAWWDDVILPRLMDHM